MIWQKIWRKQGTSPTRLRYFNDVVFTCHGKLGEFIPASNFILALIEENSTPLNFLYFTTQLFLKILAKQSITAKKSLHFTVEYLTLFECLALVRVTWSNRCLSKPAIIFVLLSSKRFWWHCTPSNFLHLLSWRFWRVSANQPKTNLVLTASLQHVNVWPSVNRRSGGSDGQKTWW